MSTALIIILAVIVLALVAFLLISQAPGRKRERELKRRRSEAATRHREVAESVESEASVAERRAQEAKHEAERARAKAQMAEREAGERRDKAAMHHGRADMHERGQADQELGIGAEERQSRYDEGSPEKPGIIDRLRGERDTTIGGDSEQAQSGRFTRTSREEQYAAADRPVDPATRRPTRE